MIGEIELNAWVVFESPTAKIVKRKRIGRVVHVVKNCNGRVLGYSVLSDGKLYTLTGEYFIRLVDVLSPEETARKAAELKKDLS